MQIEDYRVEKKAVDAKAVDTKAAGTAKEVAFVGKGVTLFLWQKQLTLDAKRNDVRMDENVRMVQLPLGSEQDVRMECSQLVADFKSATCPRSKPCSPQTCARAIRSSAVSTLHDSSTSFRSTGLHSCRQRPGAKSRRPARIDAQPSCD
jgi:hypothetical protein